MSMIKQEKEREFWSDNMKRQNAAANKEPSISYAHAGWKKYFNAPFSLSLKYEIEKATYSLHNAQRSMEAETIRRLISQCDGFGFLTMAKGGFVLSAQLGSGLVIVKDAQGKWSAPSSLIAFGSGLGLQMGVNVTDAILFFRTADAQDTFKGNRQLAVGLSGGLSMGPFGREALFEYHLRVGDKTTVALAYSLSWSKGAYVGGAIDWKYFMTLNKRNQVFYGKEVTAEDILGGRVDPPRSAAPFYQALDEMMMHKA